MSARLKSLATSLPTPTSSPILLDTLLLLLIRLGYYFLSRRFLLSALPTLRNISKPGQEGDAAAESAGPGGILGSGNGGNDEDGLINASGGLSDTGSVNGSVRANGYREVSGGQNTGRRNRDADNDGEGDEDSDTDSLASFLPPGSPSPATGTPLSEYPLLPLHSQSNNPSSSRTHHRGNSLASPIPDPHALGQRLKEVSIRAPSSGLSASGPGNGSGAGRGGGEPRKKVLRLFHGRRGKSTGRGGSGTEGERVRTSRGLGWLARNLFSLCFSESLLLLTLVMFHSLGILHSRSRRVHFSIALHLLLFLILFLVPLVQCLQLTYRAKDSRSPSSTSTTSSTRKFSFTKRLLISMIPFSLYIFIFTRIPPYITTQTPFFPTVNPSYYLFGNTTAGPTPKGLGKVSLPAHVHLGDLSELDESEYPIDMDTTIAEEFDLNLEGDDPALQEDWGKGGWLEPSLGRVVVCGIVVLGGLSGFGAVRTAWNFYENGGLKSGRPISREDIIAAERSLYRVRHDIMFKREQLGADHADRLDAGYANGNGGSGSYSPSWVGKVLGNAFATRGENDSVRREVEGLEMMEQQVAKSLEAMKLRRKRQRFAQTFRGKVYNFIGIIFAFYCIARVATCTTSVFLPNLATSHVSRNDDATAGKGNTNGDWISYIIALGLAQFPSVKLDVRMWSRAISLILTGVLILSSLAQVLRNVAKILRLTSKSVGAGFLLLGLAQLMSTYVISLLIQLRSYIPPTDPMEIQLYGNDTLPIETDFSHIKTDKDPSLLATLPDFRVFGRLFDVLFLVAAVGTALYRYIGNKLNGPDEFGTIYHS